MNTILIGSEIFAATNLSLKNNDNFQSILHANNRRRETSDFSKNIFSREKVQPCFQMSFKY